MPAVAISPPPKPRFRGIPHTIGAFLAVPAAIVCVASASGKVASQAALVYCLSLIFLLGTSAIYHTPQWTPKIRMWLRRVDHLAIFVLIAGSYTPMCLLALPEEQGHKMLIVAWSMAAVGGFLALFWPTVPRWVNVGLAIAMGWMLVPFGPSIVSKMGWLSMILLLVGGLLYSIGGITYARRSPNPAPKIFGYHEIFHCLVLAAVCCHYVAIWRMVV